MYFNNQLQKFDFTVREEYLISKRLPCSKIIIIGINKSLAAKEVNYVQESSAI